MKTAKLITVGTSALFAAVLAMAQSTTTPSSQPTPSPSSPSSTESRNSPSSTTPKSTEDEDTRPWQDRPAIDESKDQNKDSSATDQANTDEEKSSTESSSSANLSGSQATSSSSIESNTSVTASTQVDTQVKTIVQQIDSQGPVVVERVTTQFADVACTPENARMLFEALHNGTEVTLNHEGKTVSFTPTTKLGYGDAYVVLSLAAEVLRGSGVTGCATPEQWQAVLMGGDLKSTATTTTTVTSGASGNTSAFPGLLVLHSQGKSWTEVAQTTNVQMNTVVSSAESNLDIRTSEQSSVANPTGERDTSTALDSSGVKTDDQAGQDRTNPGQHKGWDQGKKEGWDKEKKDDMSTQAYDANKDRVEEPKRDEGEDEETPPKK